jgi:hypothetical protein
MRSFVPGSERRSGTLATGAFGDFGSGTAGRRGATGSGADALSASRFGVGAPPAAARGVGVTGSAAGFGGGRCGAAGAFTSGAAGGGSGDSSLGRGGKLSGRSICDSVPGAPMWMTLPHLRHFMRTERPATFSSLI